MDDKLTPLEVAAFDGGMTDNYVGAPLNQFQKADNFIVRLDKTMKTRPGSIQYHATAYRIIDARVCELFNYNNSNQLLARATSKLYYINSGAWTELQGPSGNSVFPAATASNVASSAQWQKHLYLTSDKLTSPMKAFFNSGTPKLVNAGLPAIASTPVIRQETSGTIMSMSDIYALAKDINTKLQAHFADLTEHTAAQTAIQSLNGEDWTVTKVEALLAYIESAWNSGLYNHNGDANLASAWRYHLATQTANRAVTISGSYNSLADVLVELDTFKAMFNAHDNDDTAHNNKGLHQITATLPAAGPDSPFSSLVGYTYAFVHSYTYTIDGVTYEDVGPVVYSPHYELVPISALSLYSVAISGIPTLATTENYDTANIKVKIYRTLGGGSTFFYVGQVNNGTSTFTDSYADDYISANDRLYVDGDILDNDQPPASKFVHIENNIALWGYIKENGITYPFRTRQSAADDPDSAPASNNKDIDEDLTGINGVNGKHILFGTKGVWRRDGYYDELGQGSVVHDKIHPTAGCVSNLSCVQTKDGLFWAGNDGFYFTDGYQVMKISEGLEDTYSTITSTTAKKNKIQGVYDTKRNLILWTAQLQTASTDCDTIFVLHLDHGVTKSSCFSTWSGSTNFSPTAICSFSDQILRAGGLTDATLPGYLFKHDDSYKSDLKMVAGVADPASWPKKTIIWDYLGPATGFGANERRKWVSKIMITAKNAGDASLQINSINDDKISTLKALRPIRLRGSGLYKHWARFPAGGLRCDYKQIQLTNAKTIITNSDTIALATVNNTAKTATLAVGHTSHWPADSIDYYLRFADDSYTREYLVTARTDDALTFSDSGNHAPNGSYKWDIVGYPKDEVLHIQNYIIRFAVIGQTQATFNGSEGANA